MTDNMLTPERWTCVSVETTGQNLNLVMSNHTTQRAVSCKRANTLVIKRTQVGKRGFPSTIKLTRTVAWALLQNSQYSDTATLKKVVITTA
jgi:hypothetical protein